MASAPTNARDEELLAELAELDMALARKVHAAAMASEEPRVTADLSRAYQRIARSLRQTLALKAQLERQRAKAASAPVRPLSSREESQQIIAVHTRKRALREAVLRVVWNEREPVEGPEEIAADLEDCLRGIAEAPDFLTDPLDAQVAQLCADLGLPADLAATWRDLPPHVFRHADLDEDEDEEPPSWRARLAGPERDDTS